MAVIGKNSLKWTKCGLNWIVNKIDDRILPFQVLFCPVPDFLMLYRILLLAILFRLIVVIHLK